MNVTLARALLGKIAAGRLSSLFAFAALALTSPPAPAQTVTTSWNGGAGNWNSAANWSGGVVPNNTASVFYNVLIDNGDGAASVATLNATVSIDSLVIDNQDSLSINNARTLTIVRDAGRAGSGVINNSGVISFNAVGSNTGVTLNGGDISLTGGGTVTMSNSTLNRFVGTAGTDRLINVDNTIQGAGRIGDNFMALTNQGTIDANQTATLTIDPSASGAINTGTMRATSGGALVLNGGNFTNTGGLIQANVDSSVTVASSLVTGGTVETVGNGVLHLNNSTITGGTINNSATGIIDVVSTSDLGGTLNNAAGGQIVISNSRTLNLLSSGTFNNSGNIALTAMGSNTNLQVKGGSVSLAGGGTVTLSNNGLNRILGATASDELVNVDNTIQGSGQIGANFMALNNQGTINANQSVALTIDPGAAGAVNSGVMSASETATLILNSGNFANANGTIRANALSTVRIQSSAITGGTVETVDSGEVRLSSSSITGATINNSSTGVIRSWLGENTLGGVVNNAAGGQLIVDNGRTLILQSSGTYNNSGNIALNAAGSNAVLKITGGNVTLAGGGTVTLSNHPNNHILGAAASDRLTNVNNTIQGVGLLGFNLMALTNQGTIDANLATTTRLTVDPNSNGAINTGTMQASSGGFLRLQNGVFDNTGGTIQALDGSQVEVSGSLIEGGTLSTSGTGVVRVMDDGTTLQDVGNAGNLQIGNSVEPVVIGTIHNTSNIALNSAASNTGLRLGSSQVTLTGGGTVTMSNQTTNLIVGLAASNELVNVDNLIQGAGQLGGGFMALDNQGTIDANLSVNLTIDPSTSGAVNSGTMRASSGGTLILKGGSFANTGGTIQAGSGSELRIETSTVSGGIVEAVGNGEIKVVNSTITGGTLNNSNTGVIRAFTGDTTLGGTVNNPLGGQIIIDNGRNLILESSGTFNNSGDILLNSVGSNTRLRVNDGAALVGGGTVTLSNNASNRIVGASSGDRLINVDNTIRGVGLIGENFMRLTNQGTIDANRVSSIRLIVDPVSGVGGVINTGAMQASGGGFLRLLNGSVDNAGGVIQALDASEVELSGVTLTDGTLTTSGSGVIRVLGNSTLQDVANSGNIVINNNIDPTLVGSIVNSGDIRLNSAGSSTIVTISGDVALSGAGTVTMSNNTNNRIQGSSGSVRLTNVDNTIQGAGHIAGNFMALTNQGLIDANVSNRLTVDPSSSGAINSGTMQASNGGILQLRNGEFDNSGGTIQALNGSTVELIGVAISGGALDTAGTGLIRILGSTTTLENLTNAGSIQIDNNIDPVIRGAINNSGEITMNSSGSATVLTVRGGSVSLTGGGTLSLSNNFQNRITGFAAGDQLINVDNTIRGSGQLGVNFLSLTNQGTIRQVGSALMTIDPRSGTSFDNQGELRATGAAGIDIIQTSSVFTTSGEVFVDSGSRIDVTGAFTQTAGTTVLDRGASTATLTASTIFDMQGGTLAGNGAISAPTVHSAGTIAPGLSAGQIDISGDLVLLDASILSIELGGLMQGSQYDFINVSGSATFDGDLELSFIDSFENSVSMSDDFTVLSASSFAGAFDNIASGMRLYTSDGFGSFLVDYSGNDLVLSQYQAVPEPSSMALLGIAGGAFLARRRRRSKEVELPGAT